MKKSYYCLFLLTILGCGKDIPSTVGFLFPQKGLKKGVVNKYYVHHIPKNPNEKTSTDISYSLYKLIDHSHISINSYNAGFRPTQFQVMQITDSAVSLLKDITIHRGDSLRSTSKKNKFFSVTAPTQHTLTFDRTFGETTYRYERLIESTKDSAFESTPAKLHKGFLKVSLPNNDSLLVEIPVAYMYANPLGLVWLKQKRKGFTQISELVEQMPLSAFKTMSSHNKKRVGYINPNNTLDSTSNFTLCDKENEIADYYNSDPDGGFYPNKRAFLANLKAHYDSTLGTSASGYLTFRFVINCKGEAGRFTTEMATLDFEQGSFSKKLINHLYNLLNKQSRWFISNIRGKDRDSYFYVTFKFKNGKLIDVLP